MSRDDDWKQVIFALLKHFEDNEGTTYLYFDYQRDDLYRQIPYSIRAEVEMVIELFHKR